MATRRNLRLRREYLYRKSLEGQEKEEYERKKRVREAMREGRQIPTELQADCKDAPRRRGLCLRLSSIPRLRCCW